MERSFASLEEKRWERETKKIVFKKTEERRSLATEDPFLKMGAAKRSPSFLKKVSPIRNVMSRDDAQTVT